MLNLAKGYKPNTTMTNNLQFIETFREEARELLGNLERDLLELETNPNEKELLSSIFRVMHTIKGSAAMFGLSDIFSFAHEVESVLSSLRDGAITISRDLVDQILRARDITLEMLETNSDDAEATQKIANERDEFLNRLKKRQKYLKIVRPLNRKTRKKHKSVPPAIWNQTHRKHGISCSIQIMMFTDGE